MIFINYRRRDAAGTTGRLYDHLEQSFHPDQLFMDVEDIPPGLDFVTMLEDEVRKCDVFLAVIGPSWLDIKDGQGRRLLDRGTDFVRIEIEAALRQRKLVIPVLVEGGEVPAPADLPTTIRSLARRSAIEISHERFKSDVQDLVVVLQEALADASAAREQTEQIQLNELERIRRERAEQTPVPSARALALMAHDTVVDRVQRSIPNDATEVVRSVTGRPRTGANHRPSKAVKVTLRLNGGRTDVVPLMPLPGGIFRMGGDVYDAEKPVHRVRVAPFAMMVMPVTQGLYRRTRGLESSADQGDALAVANVSWVDAVRFCNRLSAAATRAPAYRLTDVAGREVAVDAAAKVVARVEWLPNNDGFRLPTEAEFEYALRANTETDFFWGDIETAPHRYAWFADNADGPRPVGRKLANPWGLSDLAGNVWQWCWDARTDRYDVASDPVDLHRDRARGGERVVAQPLARSARHRVVRGGSFVDPAASLRSAYRHWSIRVEVSSTWVSGASCRRPSPAPE